MKTTLSRILNPSHSNSLLNGTIISFEGTIFKERQNAAQGNKP